MHSLMGEIVETGLLCELEGGEGGEDAVREALNVIDTDSRIISALLSASLVTLL
jgi:hypothetical protein